MTLRHCDVSALVKNFPIYGETRANGIEPIIRWEYGVQFAFTPSVEDTYLAVFGPDQDTALETFERGLSAEGGYIVFKGKKAMNSNYPESAPRNTLVVFEFDKVS